MTGRISFTSCLTSRSEKLSLYLSSYSGQRKLVDIACSTLQIADHGSQANQPNDLPTYQALQYLGEIKAVLYMIKAIYTLDSLQRKFSSMTSSSRKLYDQWQRGEELDGMRLVALAIEACSLINTLLSLVGLLIFKPLAAIDRHGKIGGEFHHLVESWNHLSLVRSFLSIQCTSGKLLLGSHRPLRKVSSLVFDVWNATHHLLKMSGVYLPRSLLITCVVLKCLLDLHNIYQKTM